MLKKLILSVAMLSLAACAFDKDTSDDNAREVAERQRQLNTYSRVVGFYSGKLTTPAAQQDVELRLFTLENEAGKNSNGDERYSVVLRGNYKKLNPVGPGYNFKARYIPETAELILTNDSTALGVDDIHTINAKFSGQKIIGEVKSVSGVIGVLDLTLTSNERQAPGNNEENEYYERLRRQYESIAGTYAGNNTVDGKAKFSFTISLQVIKVGLTPQIVGEFKRSDDPGESVSLTLTAVYQPELSPAILTLTGVPRFNPTNSPYKATFEGTLIGDEYKGSWRTNIKGFEGDFVLKKVK
ncbi:hypothetical protein [Bdellovibrio bacteriovorus]|uniref:hypothetical protein n=1 Tax=Bdellovibrio TaxID=958 RepID=UPI0035A95E3A